MVPCDEDQNQRQAHLSLRWETRHLWHSISSAIGSPKKPEYIAAVALALFTEAIGQDRGVSYSRRKGHYDMPKRYRSPLYTYRGVVGSIDRLEYLDLIDNYCAAPGQRRWQSWCQPKPELVDIVGGIVGHALKLAPLWEPVLLRDDEKQLIDYQDSPEVRRMRQELHEQNEAIVGADLGNVISLRGRLRRIFNGDFENGGRFYAEGGAWQTMSKAERQRILIDGEPVFEIDYSEFHPALAYAECGVSFPGNAYDVAGFPRDLVKIAVAVLFNSTSRNGARHTMAHKRQMARMILGDDIPDAELPSVFWARIAKIYPGYPHSAHSAADSLIETLLTKHKAIDSMFFVGAGMHLQRRDSDIAEAVMCRMRRLGITILPIHDSFLVPTSKADLLEAAMLDEAVRARAPVFCKRSPNVSVG